MDKGEAFIKKHSWQDQIPKVHDYNSKWIVDDKLRIPRERMVLIQKSQVLTRILLSENSDQNEILEWQSYQRQLGTNIKRRKELIVKAAQVGAY